MLLQKLLFWIHDALGRRKFEGLFRGTRDPYHYGNLEFEKRRLDLMSQFLKDRRYANALEVGCGEGFFTSRLAPIAGQVLAMDISETALARAHENLGSRSNVSWVRADLRKWSPNGSAEFDLVVLSEILYYLGERNDLFRVVGTSLEDCLRPSLEKLVGHLTKRGRVLLAHSFAPGERSRREAYRKILEKQGLRLLREEEVPPTGEPGTDRCLVSLLEL